MANFIKDYKISIIGVVISCVFWIISLVMHIDLFESLGNFIRKCEHVELDEFIIGVIIFLIFLHIDIIRKKRKIEMENEKNKIYKAMLFSTHHILNNFLNQMQIFKITAEDIKEFPKDVLDLFDEILESSKKQIKSLSEIEKIDENEIKDSVTEK